MGESDFGRHGLKNILVPTDFSALSDTALHVAIDLAGQQNARIYLLHVTSPRQYTNRRLRMENQISGFAEARSIEIVAEIRSGKTYEQIMEILPEKSIDLIVIPGHLSSGSLRDRFRNLTAKIKRKAPCSVLVVGI